MKIFCFQYNQKERQKKSSNWLKIVTISLYCTKTLFLKASLSINLFTYMNLVTLNEQLKLPFSNISLFQYFPLKHFGKGNTPYL